VVKAGLKLRVEKDSVMALYFHGIFKDKSEIDLNHVDPQQGFTLDNYRTVIEHYLRANYQFITPDDLLQGLDASGKYLMLTFDDGYYNNHQILPLLHEYQIPASFFITTGPVEQNKCFWWDVLYRERKKKGGATANIYQEGLSLKNYTNDRIEKILIKEFGKDCFKPLSDLDRLFTANELRDFSRDKYVFIGNHTKDHGILTNYSSDEVRKQIEGAQESLEKIIGKKVSSIAYPNGNYSETILDIVKELGFKFGLSTNFYKNSLRPKGDDLLRLGRFCFPNNKSVENQCELFRSDFSLYLAVKSLTAKIGLTI